MRVPAAAAFRSLKNHNYRVWAAGALVSNIGAGMQRTAQDWLVLTQLTDRSASSVGLVMALQFGPQLLLLPFTGYAADHMDQRKLLMATQGAMGLVALTLGLLTLTGVVELWHVYILAFLMGCAQAFDLPVRQTFVAELVDEADLPNAIALNAMSFNGARLIGPAVAGLAIAGVGTGWSFVMNTVMFVGIVISMQMLRRAELRNSARAKRGKGGLTAGFRYVWGRPDLMAMMIILFIMGAFGFNFPIFTSTMAVGVFHTDSKGFGLLSSLMAVGSVAGALVAAGRGRPGFGSLLAGLLIFSLGCVLAALSPGYWWFACTLMIVGAATLTITNSTSTSMQLGTDPSVRGRVMALRTAVMIGSTPIGAPIIGWAADRYGPRWAMCVAATAGIVAAAVAVMYMVRTRRAASAQAEAGVTAP